MKSVHYNKHLFSKISSDLKENKNVKVLFIYFV